MSKIIHLDFVHRVNYNIYNILEAGLCIHLQVKIRERRTGNLSGPWLS
jgi:hypothetical protein